METTHVNVEAQITQKLQKAFHPEVLSVKNESSHHNMSGQDTHFTVLLVSEHFAHQTRLERQRSVMDVLKSELLQGPIHALSLRLFTSIEYKECDSQIQTPPCQKKKK